MCLSSITESLTPSTDIVTAWKCFLDHGDGKLRFPYYTVNAEYNPGSIVDETIVNTNQWLKAIPSKVFADNHPGPVGVYQAGFHVFVLKADADIFAQCLNSVRRKNKQLVVKEVNVRLVRTKGTQRCDNQHFDVLVADQLYVPDNPTPQEQNNVSS